MEDYDRLPIDGRQFELIIGELIEKDAEGIGQDRLMTVADLDYLSSDGPRYEFLGGILFPRPSSNAQHRRTLLAFLLLLDRLVVREAAGEVIVAPPWVDLAEHDVALPDLIVLSAERRNAIAADRIVVAANLVVEVSMLTTIGRDLEPVIDFTAGPTPVAPA